MRLIDHLKSEDRLWKVWLQYNGEFYKLCWGRESALTTALSWTLLCAPASQDDDGDLIIDVNNLPKGVIA